MEAEKDKAALLGIIAGLSDGRKIFLAVTPGSWESTESGSAVLRDLKKRGLRAPRLVVGKGHLGIWASFAEAMGRMADPSMACRRPKHELRVAC